MSDTTKKTAGMLGIIASLLTIITIMSKGVLVAMSVHTDVEGARHDLINAIRKLERIEEKLDSHTKDIERLKAKVGVGSAYWIGEQIVMFSGGEQ